jgi:hypothetical protein
VKLGLSLSGVNNSINNVKEILPIITEDFTGKLIDGAYAIKDKAKEILNSKVNPVPTGYSTGKLSNSIKANILDKNRNSIGPDMREVPYAEWIEVGHYMTGGWVKKGNIKGARWWEGHHYMEGAWLEISPTIIPKIAETLNIKMNSFARSVKRTRHKTTGRFVSGWGGYN